MSKLDLSVIILTFNEEKHIGRCLESLKNSFTDIFIIDSFSTDETVSIAEKHGAQVIPRKWKNYSDQFQWALDNCAFNTKWVMRLDADEFLEPDLIDELKHTLDNCNETTDGFYLRRKYYFLGKWIRFGGVYPLHLLRIWKVNVGRIESRWMDEHIVLDNSSSTATLKGHVVDENLNDTQWWTSKHNNYATREMIDIIINKHKLFPYDDVLEQTGSFRQDAFKRNMKVKFYNKLPIFVRPTLYFFYRYFIRLGFLDGIQGFAFHFFQGFWYRALVDLRVYEMEKNFSPNDDVATKIKKLEALSGHKVTDNQ